VRAGRVALVASVPAAFVAVFFAYPVAAIVGRGLFPGGNLDLSALGRVATDPRLREIAWFTLFQAAPSTALTLALGIPGAHLLARVDIPGRSVLRALVVVPFVLPTMVVGTAFRSLFGPGAPLAALGLGSGLWAIVAAHVFFNHAVVVRTVGGLWAHLDRRQEEAARMLGAGRFRIFREVTLPQLRPAIVSAASIVFLFCFTSFGIILVLGGPRTSTLETEIYRQTAELLNLGGGGAVGCSSPRWAAPAEGRRARGRRGVRAGAATGAEARPAGHGRLVGWPPARSVLVLSSWPPPWSCSWSRSLRRPAASMGPTPGARRSGASSTLFASPVAALADRCASRRGTRSPWWSGASRPRHRPATGGAGRRGRAPTAVDGEAPASTPF